LPSIIGLLGAAICISLLEGVWTWLLAAALSEVAGQIPPSPIFLGSLMFVAWVSNRTLELRDVDLVWRRRILVGGGIGLALIAGTIHSGLVLPTHLVLGRPQPDLRGAGIALVLLCAYLWGRGLALARGIDRDRVGNHVTMSAAGLIGTLLILPLTTIVQEDGMLAVGLSFLLGIASLTFLQISGTESRRLTPFQWAALVTSTGLLLIIASAVVSGAFAIGGLEHLRRGLAGVAAFASPVTDVIFLAAGHLADYLAHLMRALAAMFGADQALIERAIREAEQQRPDQTPEFDPGSPPMIMTLTVAFFLTALGLAIMVWAFGRLIGARRSRNAVFTRERDRVRGGDALGALRSAIGRLFHRDEDGPVPEESREAIRYHYRRFQTLMARAELPRIPSQTPAEYERELEQQPSLGEAQPSLAALTNAYVLARYAPKDARIPDPEDARLAVEEIRAALRGAEADERAAPSNREDRAARARERDAASPTQPGQVGSATVTERAGERPPR
jgi:hypothetical protein